MKKANLTELMNVREVAGYLGINEKKVYFLAKARKIPCTRVTGKWTFPKKLIDRWIEETASDLVGQPRNVEERSFILAAGSDDPSLRSEEHTSELQSRGHLVCRLLLEKKKNLNRAPCQRELRQKNRRTKATKAQKKPPPETETEPTSYSQATFSSPYTETFTIYTLALNGALPI